MAWQSSNDARHGGAARPSPADSLFGSEWGFDPTVSVNHPATGHDRVFLVESKHVDHYEATYAPLALRHSRSSCRSFGHIQFMNFGEAKGLSERVLICPTQPIVDFLTEGKALKAQQAAMLYVAITRAAQSVAIILDKPGACEFPPWEPTNA